MELLSNNNICFHLSPTSSQLYSLQFDNSYINSWLVVDGDENGKFKIKTIFSPRIVSTGIDSAKITKQMQYNIIHIQQLHQTTLITSQGSDTVTSIFICNSSNFTPDENGLVFIGT